jgi:hypothetical protein
MPVSLRVRGARRLRGSRPDGFSSPPWLVIVVRVPVLVTIAQAFGGAPTAAFSAIQATSATTLLLHTSLVSAAAGANRQDLPGLIGVSPQQT